MVKSKLAKRKGLDKSLFERLAKANPTNVCLLRHQYRMSDEIMSYANSLHVQSKMQGDKEEALS